MIYLVGLERNKNKRAFRDGLSNYRLMDFGHKTSLAILTTDGRVRDGLKLHTSGTVTRAEKSALRSHLRGVDARWITDAQDWRQVIHRLAGVAQAMQSGDDDPYTTPSKQDPAQWLNRQIHFGRFSLAPLNGRIPRLVPRILIPVARQSFSPIYPSGHGFEMLGFYARVNFALPATDAFTAADGTVLTTYSANWSNNDGGFDIKSNEVCPNDAGESCAHWNADAFNNNQYSKLTRTALETGKWLGVGVRAAASAATYYSYYCSTSAQSDYLGKFVAGSFTELGSESGVFTTNDIIEIRADGTTITPLKNSSTTGIGAKTDSSISSGYAGLTGYDNTTLTRGDSWEGGDIAAAGISIPVAMYHYMHHNGNN